MRLLRSRMNKLITVFIATLSIGIITLISSPPLRAQLLSITDQLLAQIANNTLGTLNAVNNLPAYLEPITEFAKSWTNPDTTNNTKNILQVDFPQIVDASIKTRSMQMTLQKQLLSEFFSSNNVTTTRVPYANDLTYQTLIGMPFFSQDAKVNNVGAYNFVYNISGLNINHALPDKGWGGTPESQEKYTNYIKTITAIQTFDAYVLSYMYANYQNNMDLSKQQMDLITKASNADWFAEIASEDLGPVLRQILMFNSQTYILLTQLLETEKQLLLSQTITNTMLVITNMPNEEILMRRANGTAGGG